VQKDEELYETSKLNPDIWFWAVAFPLCRAAMVVSAFFFLPPYVLKVFATLTKGIGIEIWLGVLAFFLFVFGMCWVYWWLQGKNDVRVFVRVGPTR
jgi:hypothetical protein